MNAAADGTTISILIDHCRSHRCAGKRGDISEQPPVRIIHTYHQNRRGAVPMGTKTISGQTSYAVICSAN